MNPIRICRTGAMAALSLCLSLPVAEPALAAGMAPQDSVISGVCEGGVLPLGVVLPEGGFKPGCANIYTLKYGAGHGTRGTYGIVDLPSCGWNYCSAPRVHNRLRCELTHGNFCCTGDDLVGREIQNDPGDRNGLVLPAILRRWWSDSDQRGNICHDAYRGSGKRVVRVVVLQPSDANGRKSLVVAGFAYFFLRHLPTGPDEDLVGEFLPAYTP